MILIQIVKEVANHRIIRSCCHWGNILNSKTLHPTVDAEEIIHRIRIKIRSVCIVVKHIEFHVRWPLTIEQHLVVPVEGAILTASNLNGQFRQVVKP